MLLKYCLKNINKTPNQNIISTFSQSQIPFVSPVGPLYRQKKTVFPTLSYTSMSEIPILPHTLSLKKGPLLGGASLYRPLEGVTTPRFAGE